MLRIITVSTANYSQHTERLLASLNASGSTFELTIFCDHPLGFHHLTGSNCCASELEAITALGVKPAKFSAYSLALQRGDFLYLDSDIVVLEPLDELWGFDRIAACPDDLSHCDFIADRRFPWPGAPQLENKRFINSGVLFAPASTHAFFDEIERRIKDDREWERYIFPGALYDNHFLCAFLNLLDQPVQELDPNRYNWSGFMQHGVLQVERGGAALVNRQTRERLRLVHLAGVQDIDGFLCSLPAGVASLIAARGRHSVEQPEKLWIDFLGSFGGDIPDDDFALRALEVVGRETVQLARNGLRKDFSSCQSYLHDPHGVISLCYSLPNSPVTWNELKCGGAYLDGEEYNWLQHWLRTLKIKSAIEIGAGETSILFRQEGVAALSIEAQPGPWLDRARAHGCDCRLVTFDQALGRFDEPALRSALDSLGRRSVDLLFIDSPPGRSDRAAMLSQIASAIELRLVLIHDAHRDAANVFAEQAKHGYRVVSYCDSYRGLVLLGTKAEYIQPYAVAPDCIVRGDDVRVFSETVRGGGRCSEEIHLFATVENRADDVLSSRYTHPVHVSYRWYLEDGSCQVPDGYRTPLPFDLRPGNTAGLPCRLILPALPGQYLLGLSLVQEDVRWFDQSSTAGHRVPFQVV